jgi:hypothetical protein
VSTWAGMDRGTVTGHAKDEDSQKHPEAISSDSDRKTEETPVG